MSSVCISLKAHRWLPSCASRRWSPMLKRSCSRHGCRAAASSSRRCRTGVCLTEQRVFFERIESACHQKDHRSHPRSHAGSRDFMPRSHTSRQDLTPRYNNTHPILATQCLIFSFRLIFQIGPKFAFRIRLVLSTRLSRLLLKCSLEQSGQISNTNPERLIQ